MIDPTSLYRTVVSEVADAGAAVVAMFGPVAGGVITNPRYAEDQGLDAAEVLWIDVVGPATLGVNPTSIPLQPGQTYTVAPGQTTNVSVNAASAGHKFSGVVYQPQTPYPPAPQAGGFPPAGPVTLTRTIPSYLYEQYADDEDLQAFVAAYNALAQQYVAWFAAVGLAVYTSPQIAGSLLDWVAAGLYGMVRPSLSSGMNRDLGPLNTYAFNTLALNARRAVGAQNVTVTTDDIFKRIITWNFYKGDGNEFNVRWLKRRIMRFLIGVDGSAPNVDQTYLISITFGAAGAVSIRIASGSRIVNGGALFDRFAFNSMPYNALRTSFVPGPDPLPYQSVLREAVASGVLQLPFQYRFSVAA